MKKYMILIFVFYLFSCGEGNNAFKGQKITYSSLKSYTILKQKAVKIEFQGNLKDINKKAEQLYFWIRQRGMFFGGPLMIFLEETPSFKGKGFLKGYMYFPLLEGRSAPEYRNKRVLLRPVFGELTKGTYASLVYKGKIDFLEAGFIKIKNRIDEEKKDAYGKPVLIFEDTFKNINKIRKIRILYKTKRR